MKRLWLGNALLELWINIAPRGPLCVCWYIGSFSRHFIQECYTFWDDYNIKCFPIKFTKLQYPFVLCRLQDFETKQPKTRPSLSAIPDISVMHLHSCDWQVIWITPNQSGKIVKTGVKRGSRLQVCFGTRQGRQWEKAFHSWTPKARCGRCGRDVCEWLLTKNPSKDLGSVTGCGRTAAWWSVQREKVRTCIGPRYRTTWLTELRLQNIFSILVFLTQQILEINKCLKEKVYCITLFHPTAAYRLIKPKWIHYTSQDVSMPRVVCRNVSWR